MADNAGAGEPGPISGAVAVRLAIFALALLAAFAAGLVVGDAVGTVGPAGEVPEMGGQDH